MAAQVYMEFEKPLMELEKKIAELAGLSGDMDLTKEITKLEKKADAVREEIFSNLSRWQTAQIARHINRPFTMDYLDLIFTAPSVEYEVTRTDGSEILIDSPVELPEETSIREIREPWVQIDVYTPTEFIGQVMDLVTRKRGEFKAQEYLDTLFRKLLAPTG